jgi:hypothetical protein
MFANLLSTGVLALAFAQSALAGVYITNPVASTNAIGGQVLNVRWGELSRRSGLSLPHPRIAQTHFPSPFNFNPSLQASTDDQRTMARRPRSLTLVSARSTSTPDRSTNRPSSKTSPPASTSPRPARSTRPSTPRTAPPVPTTLSDSDRPT